MGYVAILLLVLLSIYGLICGYVLLRQDRILFLPRKLNLDYTFTHLPAHEEIFLLREKARIHGLWFIPEDQPIKAILIYFHGNSGALDEWGVYAEDFLPLGFGVLMPDYRAYGKSSGRLTQKSIYRDALAWYDWVTSQYTDLPIVAYGRSMGSGPATYLAAHRSCHTLILETPYFSLLSLVHQKTKGLLPTRFILRFPMRNDRYIRSLSIPVYIFHGTADELIPYQQAIALREAYGRSDALISIPGGGHNDLWVFPIYQENLQKILAKITQLQATSQSPLG